MSKPQCPYCLENINPDAQKCRHCGSDLVKTEPSSDGQTIYVLDRGFLKFAKFAIAILAIFVVFGTYVFGFDIKELVSEMRDVRKEIAKEQEELGKIRTQITEEQARLIDVRKDIVATRQTLKTATNRLVAAQKEVAAARARTVESAASAENHVIRIRAFLTRAGLLVAQLEERQTLALSTQEKETAKSAREELLAKSDTSVERPAKLWPVGQKLRVRFMGGTADQHRKVETFAREWLKFANVEFVFASTDDDAEVRVDFNSGQGSWAYVGTDALGIPASAATMNLGWVERSNVIHEFGHVLGLVHEHQNPTQGIDWNKQAVLASMTGPPNNWAPSQVEHSILKKHSDETYPGRRPYDPFSIMGYTFSEDWIASGTPPQPGNDISQSDQAYVARLYPR